ncbi:MAG: hypothetical protein ACXADX_12105 [Candidatus Hodarchaeales archaeon]
MPDGIHPHAKATGLSVYFSARKDYLAKVQTYFEELIMALKELKKQGLPLKQVFKDPSLPEYFGKHQPTWVEGSRYHTGWLNAAIKHFYKNV